MPKHVSIAALTALCLACGTTALADTPGPDWIPMTKVIQIMQDRGYTQFSEIEADDGHWEGEGLKNGQEYEFHVDPHTGEVTKDKPDH